jgi:hypothetical protein
MFEGRLMTLDTSPRGTGYCIGTRERIEEVGVLRLQVGEYIDPHAAVEAFSAWMRDRLIFYGQFAKIVYEAPMNANAQVHGANNSPETVAKQHKIIGSLITFAWCYHVKLESLHVFKHRKTVTGRATWNGKGEAKRQSIAAVKRLGLWPRGREDDDNTADAICIFVHEMWMAGEPIGKFALTEAAR